MKVEERRRKVGWVFEGGGIGDVVVNSRLTKCNNAKRPFRDRKGLHGGNTARRAPRVFGFLNMVAVGELVIISKLMRYK
jgi:hypothetical protein